MDGKQLLERIESFGEQTAIISGDDAISYKQLLDRVQQWRDELAVRGVAPGDCVAISGDFSPGTTSLMLALIANGNTALPLTRRLLAASEQEQRSVYASAVFEFDEEDRWEYRSREHAKDHPLLDELRSAGQPGLILFSSGSTGEAKASLHNFNKLLARFEQQRRAFRMLTFLLIDHMGGVNTLLSILCNGGVAVTVAERSSERVCQAVQDHRIELLPVTPTFINMMLLSQAYRRYDLSSLQYMSFGTEPMPAATLDAIRKHLPNVQFRQLYGLTELGILPTQTHKSNGLQVRLGGDGCEVRVVDGILWIRTETAMLGYLNAPSPFDDEGWFNTGDAVIEEQGYLRVLGRKSEMINVGGEKVFPAEVENVILQMDGIRDVAVRGKANPITGTLVVARVTLCEQTDASGLEREIRAYCKQRLAPFKVPAIIEIEHGELHSDRFKKIRRPLPDREAAA
jgi:acyl-coenzyme A synthetase/AMP-(fatty) acid ligase